MSPNKFDDDYVPTDYSQYPALIDEEDEEGQLPALPEKFDVPFIERQLSKIQNKPSITANYFRALRTKFSLKQQHEILKKMKEINEATAAGLGSQAEIIRARKELVMAQKDLDDADEDYNEFRELKKKQAELARMELEVEIEKKRARIRELQGETEEKEDELEAYEKRKKMQQAKREIDRRVWQEDSLQRYAENLSREDELKLLFERELEKLDAEYGNPDKLPADQRRQYEKRKEKLLARYYALKDEED